MPSFRTEAVTSEKPEVKQAVAKMFYNLGCDVTNGIEIQYDCVSKNRFGELDDSPRFVVAERLDHTWLMSKYASTAAKQYTPDTSLVVDLWKLRNKGN